MALSTGFLQLEAVEDAVPRLRCLQVVHVEVSVGLEHLVIGPSTHAAQRLHVDSLPQHHRGPGVAEAVGGNGEAQVLGQPIEHAL